MQLSCKNNHSEKNFPRPFRCFSGLASNFLLNRYWINFQQIFGKNNFRNLNESFHYIGRARYTEVYSAPSRTSVMEELLCASVFQKYLTSSQFAKIAVSMWSKQLRKIQRKVKKGILFLILKKESIIDSFIGFFRTALFQKIPAWLFLFCESISIS